jgi:S1-C subfamily serine protease
MALFNKEQLKTIVLIEREQVNFAGGVEYVPHATGFLVGFLKDNNTVQKNYSLFLISNRHVFDGFEKLWFRFDTDTNTVRFPVPLKDSKGMALFLQHSNPKVDLAMMTVAVNVLNQNNVKWSFFQEENIKLSKDFTSSGIELGDEIFVIGFPMGISGSIQNYPIIRSGSIARLDTEILNEHFFLIDSFVFPGNSGGPVVMKPQAISLVGTVPVSSTYLVGVVSGFRLYQEPLYSLQTNPPKVAGFANQNSGLSSVVPMDYAKDIYQDWLRTNKPIEQVEANKEETDTAGTVNNPSAK